MLSVVEESWLKGLVVGNHRGCRERRILAKHSARAPFGGARQCLVADCDFIRKLAGRCEIFGDLFVVVGVIRQIGFVRTRIEDDDLFLQFIANPVKRTDVVRVSTDQHEGFRAVLECVENHFGGKVDVCALFFKSIDAQHAVPRVFAGTAGVKDRREPFLAVLVISFNDAYARVRRKSLKIDILPLNWLRIVRMCLDARSEVLDGNDLVVASHEGVCELLKIKPLQFGMEPKKPMVKIAAIDIYDCLHTVLDAKVSTLTSRDLAPLRQNLAVRCAYIIAYFPVERKGVSDSGVSRFLSE